MSIPAFDSGNPAHFRITPTNNGWSKINDPAYRRFYVEPGDYRHLGAIPITQTGTESAPRTISLHNGNDLHPGKLPRAEHANVILQFQGVSHWVVDRMSSLDHSDGVGIRVMPVSSDIVFNRLYMTNFHNAVYVLSGTSNVNFTRDITIQNSRFDGMSRRGINDDGVAVFLHGSDWAGFRRVQDVHILNNEFINCNDAIQAIRFPDKEPKQVVDYQGLLIDGNHLYVDSSVYTDGAGNPDPDGDWALTENAIDLKGGSQNPANPVVVMNNTMWGWRRTDTNGGGSGSWGAAVVCHFGVWNVRFSDNLVFDSARGIVFGDKADEPYSGTNVVMSGNILESIGDFWTVTGEPVGGYYSNTKGLSFTGNVLVANNQPVATRWLNHNGSEQNMTVAGNTIIGNLKMTGTRSASTVVTNNLYYGCTPQEPGDGTVCGSAADARMSDLVFVTDRFSNNPRSITVPGVLPVSPPAAPANLTARAAGSTRIALAWADRSGNETGFKIDRRRSGTTPWVRIATVAANSSAYSDTGLPPGTKFYYLVKAANAGGNSAYANKADAATLDGVAGESVWRYRKGTAEASSPPYAWRLPGFDDSGWAEGRGPIGYSDHEAPLGTELADMRGGYSCVFLRRAFTLAQPAAVSGLELRVAYDDGFVLWINGREVARVNVAGPPADAVPHDAVADANQNSTWTTALAGANLPDLHTGLNVIAVQLLNRSLSSSGDCLFDMELSAVVRSLSVAADSDGNAMPDDWEAAHLSELSDPSDLSDSGDPDGDGLSNLEEYIAGTDPTDETRNLKLETELQNGQVVVSIETVAASGPGYEGLSRHYTLEWRAGLDASSEWGPLPGYEDIIGAGQTVRYTADSPAPLVFRARVWLD
ncbi:MAG: fibronectin type III domain-containing protein [Kiritimatiellae bacterium]|nr:fibronectin type III domain-containing protein [Kiritimatiellia bacterium]